MGLAAVTQARIAGIAVRNQKMKSREYEPVSRIRKSKKENPLGFQRTQRHINSYLLPL